MEEVLGEMDPIEAEVDAIRQRLWEETKDMTTEERWAYMKKRSKIDYEKFHFKFVSLPPVKSYHRVRED